MNLESDLEIERAGAPNGTQRSSHWPVVRAAYLKDHPACALCGGTEKLEVHHIRPFHVHPEFELDPTNFITLCEANKFGIDCHLMVGHLGSFKSWNENVIMDASVWNVKIKNRPLVEV